MAGAGTVPLSWSIGRRLRHIQPLMAPQQLSRMNGAGESWRCGEGSSRASCLDGGRAHAETVDHRHDPHRAFGSGAAAQAKERTLTGAAIGAGVGAVVLGPIGAVAGGAGGAAVGGPRVSRAARICWRDKHGTHHCRYRY
jgi:osmotically inducible lipoprotein OsmB